MREELHGGKTSLKGRWYCLKYKIKRDASHLIERSRLAIKNKDIHYFLYDGALLKAYVEIQRLKKTWNNLDKIEHDYMDACFRSAFKCYKVFCAARHSGLSASITFDILEDLYNGKPLTPITEEDEFSYAFTCEHKSNTKGYQCARYGALFRFDTPNGPEYTDNNRVITIEKNTGKSFYTGAVSDYINKLHPITLPYTPIKAEYKVYIDYYILRNPKDSNHDFEAMRMLYYVKKDEDTKNDIDLYITYDEEHNEVLTLTPIEWEAKYAEQYMKV